MVLESRQALKLWQAVPAETKRAILGNVWCSECKTSVTICDYSARLKGDAVVLQGFCAQCGHEVARVVEGCVPAIKKARRSQKADAFLYIFDVWLWGDARCTIKHRIVRKIQIPCTKTLYQFAEVITKAFDFDLDHCFAFYERREGHFFAGKSFELFVDIGEEPTVDGAKGVKKAKVEQAFKSPGEKMIFFFDYGDSWQFEVELKEIKPAGKWSPKSAVLEKIGKAPLQYPPCEDDVQEE